MQKEIDSLKQQAKEKLKENKKFLDRLRQKPPKHLDTIMQDLHTKTFNKVDCLECANCCKTTSPIVTDKDTQRIAKHLKMKPHKLIEQYLVKDADDDYVGGFIYSNDTNTLTFKQNNVDALTINGTQAATFAGGVTVDGFFTSQGIDDNANANAITINGNEEVGIGQPSPFRKLHVNSGTTNVVARFESTDTTAAIEFKDNNGSAEVGNIGDNVVFFPAGAEKMRITSAGDVGIGVTSPQQKLTLGSVSAGGIQFNYDSTNNYRHQILNYWNSNTDSRMDFNIARTSGQTPETIMSVGYGGNVGIGTDAPPQRLSLFAGTNESVYDVLGVYNSVTGTTAQNKGAAIRIGIGVDGSYSTKIATIYEGNNPNFLQPALAFYTMHNTYLKDSETEKMRISSNGNVGIGFTSPGSTPLSSMKLSVNGNGYFAGNVGIGTTSPSGKLSVTGTGTASAPTFDVINTSTSQFNHSGEAMAPNMTTGQNNIFVIGVASSTKNSGYIGYKYSGTAGSNANVLTFGHWGSDNLMNIDGLGNVGIGMTSPQYKLDVDGQIRAEGIVNIGGIGVAASGALANVDINDTDTNGTSTSYQPNITFKAAGVLKAQIGKLSGSTNYFTAAKNFDGPVNIIASEIHSGHTHSQEYIFGYEPGNNLNTWGLNLVDGTNTANSLYIGAEGLNSGSSIYFHGTSNALCVTRISLNQSLGQWLFDSPDCGSSNISVKWRQYNMGGYMQNMIDFEDDGDIKNINGSYGTISSDERVKENIVDATSKLDDILSLSVKNFNFIGDNKKQIGLIAQDVESIFPSWVKTSDTRIYKTHDENGVPLEEQGELVSGHEDGKSLKVGMEFAILTKAIQEQQEIIESLKQRIEQLEN